MPVLYENVGTGGGGMGDITNALNVGGGVELFKQKNGSILEFRTLTAGPGTSITQMGDLIEVANIGSGDVTDGANVGGANAWFVQNNLGILEFNTFSVIGGLNATLLANVWTIDATPLSDAINALADGISSLQDSISTINDSVNNIFLNQNRYEISTSAAALINMTFSLNRTRMYVATGAAAQVFNLPLAPVNSDDGQYITVKSRTASPVAVSGNGLNIDGSPSNIPIGQNSSLTFVYFHAIPQWFVI